MSWVIILFIAAAATGLLSSSLRADASPSRALLQIACAVCEYAAPAAITMTFYFVARRRFLGLAWALLPCLLCAAIASLTFVKTFFEGRGGRLVVGAAQRPDLLKLALPMAAALVLELLRRRAIARQCSIETASAV